MSSGVSPYGNPLTAAQLRDIDHLIAALAELRGAARDAGKYQKSLTAKATELSRLASLAVRAANTAGPHVLLVRDFNFSDVDAALGRSILKYRQADLWPSESAILRPHFTGAQVGRMIGRSKRRLAKAEKFGLSGDPVQSNAAVEARLIRLDADFQSAMMISRRRPRKKQLVAPIRQLDGLLVLSMNARAVKTVFRFSHSLAAGILD